MDAVSHCASSLILPRSVSHPTPVTRPMRSTVEEVLGQVVSTEDGHRAAEVWYDRRDNSPRWTLVLIVDNFKFFICMRR